MYTDEQRRSHIYDLQTFLRRIQRDQGYPNPIAPDGIFGPETAAAVRDFQRQNSLPRHSRSALSARYTVQRHSRMSVRQRWQRRNSYHLQVMRQAIQHRTSVRWQHSR